MVNSLDNCNVAYAWDLPDGLPNVHGFDSPGRRLVIAPRGLRIEHWPESDSPGALHVFVDGTRIRTDGTPGGNKGLGYSDEPERWAPTVQHTDALPDWARPYVAVVRAWESARGNERVPRLRLV